MANLTAVRASVQSELQSAWIDAESFADQLERIATTGIESREDANLCEMVCGLVRAELSARRIDRTERRKSTPRAARAN